MILERNQRIETTNGNATVREEKHFLFLAYLWRTPRDIHPTVPPRVFYIQPVSPSSSSFFRPLFFSFWPVGTEFLRPMEMNLRLFGPDKCARTGKTCGPNPTPCQTPPKKKNFKIIIFGFLFYSTIMHSNSSSLLISIYNRSKVCFSLFLFFCYTSLVCKCKVQELFYLLFFLCSLFTTSTSYSFFFFFYYGTYLEIWTSFSSLLHKKGPAL